MMLLLAPMGKTLEEVKAMDDTDTTLYIDRAEKNRQVLTKKVQEVAKQYDCPATHSCKLTRIKWLVYKLKGL